MSSPDAKDARYEAVDPRMCRHCNCYPQEHDDFGICPSNGTGQQPSATEYRCLNSTCGSRRNPNKVGDGVLSCPRCGHAVELVQPAASAEKAVGEVFRFSPCLASIGDRPVEAFMHYAAPGEQSYVRSEDYDALRASLAVKDDVIYTLDQACTRFGAELDALRASLAEREGEIETARRTGAYWKDELLAANATIAAKDKRIAELEKDAARYRWLRDHTRGGDDIVARHNDDPLGLDAAIDAALADGVMA